MVNMSDEEEVEVMVAENVEQNGEDEELPWEQKQDDHERIDW